MRAGSEQIEIAAQGLCRRRADHEIAGDARRAAAGQRAACPGERAAGVHGNTAGAVERAARQCKHPARRRSVRNRERAAADRYVLGRLQEAAKLRARVDRNRGIRRTPVDNHGLSGDRQACRPERGITPVATRISVPHIDAGERGTALQEKVRPDVVRHVGFRTRGRHDDH